MSQDDSQQNDSAPVQPLPNGAAADAGESAPPESGDDAAATEPVAEVDPLTRAQEDAAEYRERWVRKTAEFENLRRRTQREREEQRKYAAESVLKEFVTVADDLDRALEHAGNDASFDALREGVDMVTKKVDALLQRFGVTAISAMGEPFNPELHEAIQKVEDPSVPNNTVVTEYQRGYRLHDRLLRPSMVVVSGGGPERDADDGDGE